MHPCMENMLSQQASVTSVRHENVYEPGLMYACKCGRVCVCVRAYLLCRAECCGQRKAGVPACPGSLGHHCPPPDSENGSESTPQLYGKARHSQTQRCHAQTHTEKKKEGEIFSMVHIMINYCWILYQMGELRRLVMLDTKQTPNNFKSNISFVLFCCLCKVTKLNEKKKRNLFWNVFRQKADWLQLRAMFFWNGIKM